MKTYIVTQKKLGKIYKDTISAQSVGAAKQIAQNKRGGNVIKVDESNAIDVGAIFNKIFEPRLKMINYIATLRQLAVMTDAGISIHDSVSEVVNSSHDKKITQIFTTIRDDLNSGMSLGDSIEQFRNDIGSVSIALIRLGEQTGRLAESLKQLVDILQDVYDNRQKFKKAIRYPITVIVAIIVAFVILMLLVVPKFRELFESFGAELPLPTRILLNIEYALTNYGHLIAGAFVLFIMACIYFYRHSKVFKYNFDKYILKVYLIGNIIFYSTMNRFNLVFGELIHSGIPITDALNTALLNVENDWIKERLDTVSVSVSRGNSLSAAIYGTAIYEHMLVQMIRAGERSGNIDSMVGKVTDYYKEKFNNIIDNISAYVEPILLAFIAVMVLMMALGIFMPMWEIGRAAQSF